MNSNSSKIPTPAENQVLDAVKFVCGAVKKDFGSASQFKSLYNTVAPTLKNLEQTKSRLDGVAAGIEKLSEDALNHTLTIKETKEQIKGILDDARRALSSATSAGLAKEFNARRKVLSWTGWFWIVILVISLVVAAYLAWYRLGEIQPLLAQPDGVSVSVLLANFFVSAVFVVGPFWIAWLSTKKISFCSRICEDYAIKAAVAAEYVGVREEVESLKDTDKGAELRIKLLESTIDQFNRDPLRHIERKAHGMPLSEVLDLLKISETLVRRS